LIICSGLSEADIRKRLALEEEELKQLKMPIPVAGTHVKYLTACFNTETAQ